MQTHRRSGPQYLSKLWPGQHSLNNLLVSKFILGNKPIILQATAVEKILTKRIEKWKTKSPQIYALRPVLQEKTLQDKVAILAKKVAPRMR